MFKVLQVIMSNNLRRAVLLAIPGLTASLLITYLWYQSRRKTKSKRTGHTNPKTCSSKLSADSVPSDISHTSILPPKSPKRKHSFSLQMTCIEEDTELSSPQSSVEVEAVMEKTIVTGCSSSLGAESNEIMCQKKDLMLTECTGTSPISEKLKHSSDTTLRHEETHNGEIEPVSIHTNGDLDPIKSIDDESDIFSVDLDLLGSCLPLGASATSAGEEDVDCISSSAVCREDGGEDADDEEDDEELVVAVTSMNISLHTNDNVASGSNTKKQRKGSEASDDNRSTSPTDSGVHMTTSPIEESVHLVGGAVAGCRRPRPLPGHRAAGLDRKMKRTNAGSCSSGSSIGSSSVMSSCKENHVVLEEESEEVVGESIVNDWHNQMLKEEVKKKKKINDNDQLVTEEFLIPNKWAALFIGRNGYTIRRYQDDSDCRIYITDYPDDNDTYQVVVVSGLAKDTERALRLIRRRFPLRDFPDFIMQRVEGHAERSRKEYYRKKREETSSSRTSDVQPATTIMPNLQLPLPESVRVEVVVSSIMSCGQFFVQQPTHPSYSQLSQLDACMSSFYSQVPTAPAEDGLVTELDVVCDVVEIPSLSTPVVVGVMCAAPFEGGWYRAQVVNVVDEEQQIMEVRFSDYGGYSNYHVSELKQLRTDFLYLPLQANECYLANVVPVDEANPFSAEANSEFEQVSAGRIVEVEVVDWASDGHPYVNLYRQSHYNKNTLVLINRELVNRGFVKWIDKHNY